MIQIADILKTQAIALIIACVLDLIFGDPNFPLHPIRLMGYLIGILEKIIRFILPKNKLFEIFGGFLMAVIVIAVSAGLPLLLLHYAYEFDVVLGVIVEAVICYFMLSAKSLSRAAKKVYNALLRHDILGARRYVSMIVGRDTESLDDAGITRAAVETVAENTTDGVIAPLLYMAIGGAVLGCVYKAVNTMDSMVGYKNDKYINFGKFPARLDDVLNYMPSRIAAYLMIIAAYFMGLDGGSASLIHKRDSHKHQSPNSAQTESVAAGALGVQLGGNAYYFGSLVEKPTIGDAVRNIQYGHIMQTVRLMYLSSFMAAVILIGIKLLIGNIL